jgi:hypothetical protein
MQTTKRADQMFAAVLFIGIGIIAFLNYWWPGIMFVIGAGLLASELSESGGQLTLSRRRVISAIVIIGIGLLQLMNLDFGRLWPIVLIGVGVALLSGRGQFMGRRWSETDFDEHKSKNRTVPVENGQHEKVI